MGLKILLNIFYNIAIFVLALGIVWCFNHQQYSVMAGAAFFMALFIYFKIRLIKNVKELTKKP